jgi:hypothetical protein
LSAWSAIGFSNPYLHQLVRRSIAEHENTQDAKIKSSVNTALNRFDKAIGFADRENWEKFRNEMVKIFGNDFPAPTAIQAKTSMDDDYSMAEEFIEDKFPVVIDENVKTKIECIVTQNGFQPQSIRTIPLLKKSKQLDFEIETSASLPFDVYWKVRNYGKEARKSNDLRGEIRLDLGSRTKRETTRYVGRHVVTGYIVKSGHCISEAAVNVKIGADY